MKLRSREPLKGPPIDPFANPYPEGEDPDAWDEELVDWMYAEQAKVAQQFQDDQGPVGSLRRKLKS